MAKNKYVISDNYMLSLENELLRERLVKIQAELDKLKKLVENAKEEREKSHSYKQQLEGQN